MADNPRRRFLKASAGLVPGLALASCTDEEALQPDAAPILDRGVLETLGRIVLQRTALADSGVSRVVREFLQWLERFEPVSERDHPYESGEILYGPPDPAPLWGAQLEALGIEADKRYSTSYTELSEARQREILERQLPGNLPVNMPYAGEATHVAIGLVAWFYATPEANDLALQARIGRQTCRGLSGSTRKPEPLGS
jgi:hypothetical protein